MRTSAGVTYLHSDHLGSTSATSGAINSSSTYYPFGAVRSGTLPTDYTFTGQKRDNEANLMFYNARYYDAGIGRFTQADTLVPNLYNPQALNRYAYVRNNPVRYTDPSGHREECEYPLCGKEGTGTPIEPPVLPPLGGWKDPDSIPITGDPPDPYYTYSDEIEDAFSRAYASPTARPFIHFARTYRVVFQFEWWMDTFSQGGFLTQGDTIFMGMQYSSHGGGKQIPPDLLIHEIVHVLQNAKKWPTGCGCSLENEREAATIHRTVYAEIRGIPVTTDTDARVVYGIYSPSPWQDSDYNNWRWSLGRHNWLYLLFPTH